MGLHIQFNDKSNAFVGFYLSNSDVKYKIVKENNKSTLHLLHLSNSVIQVCEYVEFIKISNDQGVVLYEEKSSYKELTQSLPGEPFTTETILKDWINDPGTGDLVNQVNLSVSYGEGLAKGKQRIFVSAHIGSPPKFIAIGFKDLCQQHKTFVPLWVICLNGERLEFNEVYDALKKEIGLIHYRDDLFKLDTSTLLASYKVHTKPKICFSDKNLI